MKKYKITEAQYKKIVSEGVIIKGSTDATGKADISKTAQEISTSGISPKNVKVEFDGTQINGGGQTSNTMEEGKHRIVSKKELYENRKRYLKENSDVYTFDNFIKSLH